MSLGVIPGLHAPLMGRDGHCQLSCTFGEKGGYSRFAGTLNMLGGHCRLNWTFDRQAWTLPASCTFGEKVEGREGGHSRLGVL